MIHSDDPPEKLRAEAMNPATSPDRLLELIPISHELRQLTMQNPNMPPKALCQLAGQYPQQFLANPALPLLLVEDPRLGDRLTFGDLQRLSRFETVPALLLATYPYMLMEEAQTHVNLAGEVGAGWEEEVRDYLRQPQNLPSDARRLDILSSPGMMPLWLLTQLATHRNAFVREVVFTHPDLPDLLREWMYTGDPALGRQCVQEGFLEAEQVAEHQPMMSSKAKRRRLAERSGVAPEILRELAQNDDATTRQRVAANPHTPLDILRGLAADANANVRYCVARNPEADDMILERLWEDDQLNVRCAVARRPHLSAGLWEYIAQTVTQLPEAVQRIFRHRQDTPPDLLAELIVNFASEVSVDTSRHTGTIKTPVAQSEQGSRLEWRRRIQPEGSSEVDITLLKNCPFASVRHAFAVDSHAMPSVLKALATDKDITVRYAVASHPHVPVAVLETLAGDRNMSVRSAVARHPLTPAATLARALKDLNLSRLEKAWRRISRRADAADREIAAAIAVAYIYAVWNRRNPRSLLWRFRRNEPRMRDYVEIDGTTKIVCMAMLASSVTPTSALDDYAIHASWCFWQLRYVITRNPNTSTELLETLSHDGNRYVRASAREALTSYR